MCRAHDKDRLDRLEEVRLIAFTSIQPYLKDPMMTMDKFMPLPSDSNPEVEEEQRTAAKKIMDEVTAKYKEFYKR